MWKPTISTHHLFEGAKEAHGCIVLFDVFRACSTASAILTQGAERIVLVPDTADARVLKAKNPEFLFYGEEGGVKLDDAEGDNSPTNAMQMDVTGKTIILRTSSGVPGFYIVHGNGSLVIGGALVNADAVLNYLSELQPDHISLVAMGASGIEHAREDELGVEYYEAALTGSSFDMEAFHEELMQHETSGAHRLKHLGLHDDLQFCSTLSSLNVVPVLQKWNDHLVLTTHE